MNNFSVIIYFKVMAIKLLILKHSLINLKIITNMIFLIYIDHFEYALSRSESTTTIQCNQTSNGRDFITKSCKNSNKCRVLVILIFKTFFKFVIAICQPSKGKREYFNNKVFSLLTMPKLQFFLIFNKVARVACNSGGL